jgi:adenylosuccinate synthase
MIVDLQFGSTGKGLFAGYLAKQIQPDTLIAAWAPNAGHTFIDAAGRKFVNIALPNGIVAPSVKRILLGPGSVIDPDRLMWEMAEYHDVLKGKEIIIHPHAAVVSKEDRNAEREYGFRIGSTMKGVGEAVIRKVRRAEPFNVAKFALQGTPLADLVMGQHYYDEAMDAAQVAVVEGAQGYSLGMNSGFYPYTTSRECTVQQLLVDCAIPIGLPNSTSQTTVYGVARTFPIRVANRFDAEGVQVGTSGPCYFDQDEIEWKDIGLEPELTTVTKLPRRIFTFSEEQIRQAIRMNGVDHVFLNFCNYFPPGDPRLWQIVRSIEQYAPVGWFGFGATEDHISPRHEIKEPVTHG